MSHSDPEFLALAALGEHAGTPGDAAHLSRCPDCQLELDRLTRLVGLTRDEGPVFLEQPPDSVWERIAAATGQAETVASRATVQAKPVQAMANGSRPDAARSFGPPGATPAGPRPAGADPARRRRRRLGLAAAGVAAGLIIGIGGTAAVEQLTRPPAFSVVAQVQLHPLPQFPRWQHSGGTAVLRDTQAAEQLTVSVTAPSPTGFFEVWLLGSNGTSMISLGDLNADDAGTFTLPAGVNLRFYSRVDISLQPFNGSTLHSATSVVRGSLPATVAGRAQ